MAIEQYLHLGNISQYRPNSQSFDQPDNDVLENLVHQKSGILAKKLDILAAEMKWRLYLANGNLKRLESDRDKITDMLQRLDRDANYQLREHQEKAPFYRKLFEIETEKRSQQTECWRDIVMVMRYFLTVWEAHEQAKARAMFINDVGTRPEESV